MKFTKEAPKVDGYYLWRMDLNFDPRPFTVLNGYTEASVMPSEMAGEWCRLFPADECVPKVEVEAAYKEGLYDGKYVAGLSVETLWEKSIAKHKMEGLE